MTPEFWRGRKVFQTGHTGFKGSWLTEWLATLGAAKAPVVVAVGLGPTPGRGERYSHEAIRRAAGLPTARVTAARM